MNNEFDYMAALYIIVMPLAKEFAPELVLISAGFDAAYCDQIVELDSFGQAIKHWPNKVLAILEGGYLPESYAECASQLTRGLQVDLPLTAHQKSLNTCMVETIWSGLCHHSKRWESAAVMLSRLQQQQVTAFNFQHYFNEYEYRAIQSNRHILFLFISPVKYDHITCRTRLLIILNERSVTSSKRVFSYNLYTVLHMHKIYICIDDKLKNTTDIYFLKYHFYSYCEKMPVNSGIF
uniref:Histone deacetylase domain-containing protein n=1 Tax=Parascaris equorum TaxID=6256 RepID=A0A914R4S0_PAREQ